MERTAKRTFCHAAGTSRREDIETRWYLGRYAKRLLVPARTIHSVPCESVPMCISTSRSVIWNSTFCSGSPAEKTISARETISTSGVLLAVAVCVRENHSMGIKCPPALRMKSTPADVLGVLGVVRVIRVAVAEDRERPRQ